MMKLVNQLMMPLSCLASLAVATVSCGAESGSSAELEEVSEGLEQGAGTTDLGDRFTDKTGATWVRTRRVSYIHGTVYELPPENPEQSRVSLLDVPFSEAVEALRPFMEFGGSEYTLIEEDAIQNAEEVLAVLRNPNAYPTYGAPLEGEPDETSPDDGEVRDVSLVKKGIVGADGRQSIHSSRGSSPWNKIAWFEDWCTGFKLINTHTLVTSAHCQNTGTEWMTRKDVKFGTQPELPSGCYSRIVPGCWDGSDTDCDYAVLRLQGGGPYCDENNYDVGAMGWTAASDDDDNITGIVAGYPKDELKPEWDYPELVSHSVGGAYTGSTNVFRLYYTNDTSGGQSGAPYMNANDHQVRAIHSGEYDTSENYGRSMRSDLATWISNNGGYAD